MMDNFWSRARALESRHTVAPAGETPDDRIREIWRREEDRRREDALIAWANKELAAQDLLLARHNLFANPDLGKFVVKKITNGQIVASNVSPQWIAQRLAEGVTTFHA